MKASLGKLRRIAVQRGHGKEKRDCEPSVPLDQLTRASQDMQDMRNCYDSLLSAAAATANSAYEFSESLQDLGACLLEKTTVNDEDESCKVLSVLGNVQFELQKLVDFYRTHVIMTITNPSESLLNELRTVEEMKRQCDEKRNLYEDMVAQQREKGRSKIGKGVVFTSQQLQTARDEYDEEATLFVFRLKSLKQGQYRSLLTQAARHHAAQLNFFRKGLKSLEEVEPQIRLATEKLHIDYQISGLDDGEGGEDEGVSSDEINDDGELSFDYRSNKQGHDASIPRNSMEVDQVDILRPQVSTSENAEVNLNKGPGDQFFNWEPRVASYSAPIYAEKKFDPTERIKEMQPSSARKFHSYVLPTPVDVKSSNSSRTTSSDLRPTSRSGNIRSLWHSSPMEPEKHAKDFADDNSSVPTISKPHMHNAYNTKKVKRQAFSGPLTSKPLSTKPDLFASGPITSTEFPQLVSGLLSQVPIPQPPSSSPKVSPGASPPIASSPKINELHELPRPPGGLASKPASGHSAPLFRNQELSLMNKSSAGAFGAASQLPTPPLIVPRSFSIPSSNQRAMALHMAKLLESPKLPQKAGEVNSPPLTPISLSNVKQLSTVSEAASHSGQIEGES